MPRIVSYKQLTIGNPLYSFITSYLSENHLKNCKVFIKKLSLRSLILYLKLFPFLCRVPFHCTIILLLKSALQFFSIEIVTSPSKRTAIFYIIGAYLTFHRQDMNSERCVTFFHFSPHKESSVNGTVLLFRKLFLKKFPNSKSNFSVRAKSNTKTIFSSRWKKCVMYFVWEMIFLSIICCWEGANRYMNQSNNGGHDTSPLHRIKEIYPLKLYTLFRLYTVLANKYRVTAVITQIKNTLKSFYSRVPFNNAWCAPLSRGWKMCLEKLS